MSALVNIRPGLPFVVQKLEPGVSPWQNEGRRLRWASS
jgi:hypothetical protein